LIQGTFTFSFWDEQLYFSLQTVHQNVVLFLNAVIQHEHRGPYYLELMA
jgi:hypothetical protein